MRALVGALGVLGAGAGCPSTTPPPVEPPPPAPIALAIGGEAEIEDDALDGVRVARVLAGDVVVKDLVDSDRVVVEVGGAVVVDAAAGEVRDAVAVDAALGEGGGILIATDGGLVVRRGDALVASPLAAVFPDVHHLATAPGALWVADASGLYRYGVDDIVRVDVDGAAITDVTALAAGAVVDGKVAVLVQTPAQLLAVFDDASGTKVVVDGPVDAAAVVAGGDVWFVADGKLHKRASNTAVQTFTLPSAVTDVAGARGVGAFFVATAEGVVSVDVDDGGALVARAAGAAVDDVIAGADGDVVLVRGAVVSRAIAGRHVRFAGLADAALLEDGVATAVAVTAVPERLGATVAVDVDGVAQALPLALDPSALTPGPHTLRAVATYPDGDVRSAERIFFAQTRAIPTWTDNVSALSDSICSRCHTPQGGAHLLNSSELWRAEIDGIVTALDDGIMPPGQPLDDETRRVVRLWRATGMQE